MDEMREKEFQATLPSVQATLPSVQYILSKQTEWGIAYKKQQSDYNLKKNRAEKAKSKELKSKKSIKIIS